jgi:hypothetical protein
MAIYIYVTNKEKIMKPTSRCEIPVILHGMKATMKGVKHIKGERCAEIWQGSSQYFIPMSEVKYA